MCVVKPEENLSLSEYLYSLRFYILFVSILFIGSIIFGYVGFFGGTFSRPMGRFQQLSEVVEDFTQLYPLWIIFLVAFVLIILNNVLTCFLNIVLGPLLAIAPVASMVFNGGLIGCLAQKRGLIIFIGIIPHGIFEIPALLLSGAIGLRIGREVLKNRAERNLKSVLNKGLRVFLVLILPLLLIAAVIESSSIVATLFLL
ncbi:hypothetical protein ES705_29855 [subsurface metagenome]|nr:hypothetical protein [Methanosarcinales archaeon]